VGDRRREQHALGSLVFVDASEQKRDGKSVGADRGLRARDGV